MTPRPHAVVNIGDIGYDPPVGEPESPRVFFHRIPS